MAKGGGIKAGGAKGDTGSATLNALKRFEQKNGEGGLFPMSEARKLSPLKGAAFEKEMLHLFNTDKIILHNHDYIVNVEPAKLATFIKDSYGNHYHAWAIRRGS
jgi:hypothetical protein